MESVADSTAFEYGTMSIVGQTDVKLRESILKGDEKKKKKQARKNEPTSSGACC